MRKIIFVLFISMLFTLKVNANEVSKNEELNLCPNAKSAILYESKTNTLLYNKEMNLRLPPASMTKIMTLLLIYEALDNNVISMNTLS